MISVLTSNNIRYEIASHAYPDHSLLLSLPYDNIKEIMWHYENDAELFTLICIRRHYADLEVMLTLPYIPHARMDRVKDTKDVFTLKYFCEVINSLNFTKVVVLDPHSNVAPALLDRVEQQNIEPILQWCINKIYERTSSFTIFLPDEGAKKRYAEFVSGIPYTFGVKTRDWNNGQIQNLQIVNSELVKDKDVLIIDDICSRGGTFLHSAKALKEAGAANIYLYITHAEQTMVTGEMYQTSELITHIYTTDSIFKSEWDNLNKVTIMKGWVVNVYSSLDD